MGQKIKLQTLVISSPNVGEDKMIVQGCWLQREATWTFHMWSLYQYLHLLL